MPLETCVASKVRMKRFATPEEFNKWVSGHGKRVRLVHITNTPTKEGWRILLTYQEIEKVSDETT